MKQFAHHQLAVQNDEAHPHSFTHLVGAHALRLVQMVRADRGAVRKRDLLDTWKRLDKLNDAWIALLCRNETTGSEFHETCKKLVHGYTESIGDYILEGACHADRVEALTRVEGQFYGALRGSCSQEVTQRQWVYYTDALVDYVAAVDLHGVNSEPAWDRGASVLVAGRMLGLWLDQSI